MPLFLPAIPTMQALVPDFTDLNNAANVALTLQRIYFVPTTPAFYSTIVSLTCQFGAAPTGNCSMGIYDSADTGGKPLNLLAGTGAIAATAGLFTQNLTANLFLVPGSYWLAWLDTVADAVGRSTGIGTNGQEPSYVSNNTFTVLPNPLTGGVAATPNKVAMFGHILGKF